MRILTKIALLPVVAMLCSVACSAQIKFLPGITFPLGMEDLIFSIVAGDFNKDGNNDIATCNYSSRSVSIFKGDGQGSFAPAVHIFLEGGGGPHGITSADLNGDGNPDLAVANHITDSVNLLYGDGTGSFPQVLSFAVADGPRSITVGDFDGDGKPDLVTANAGLGGYSISVLLNNGSGGFHAAKDYFTTGSTHGVVCADFNGDGKTDIATANYSSSDVSLFTGDGSGGFSAAVSFATGNGANSICAADFNDDGNMDLATSNVAAISVLMGNGQGAFSSPVHYSAGTYPYSIACSDFDDDNKLDMAVINVNSDDAAIFSGDGTGKFALQKKLPVGKSPHCVVSADFNGDTKADLVAANAYSYDLTLLLNASPPKSTSAKSLQIDTDVKIFPNPCRGMFTIISSDKTAERVEVFNLMGRKVLTLPMTPGGIVTIGNLSEGVYFLNILFSGAKDRYIQKVSVY